MARFLFSNFQSVTMWLSSSTPSFPVRADQISVILQPEEFHSTLINLCSQAVQRISLASLYLGVGEKEQNLINAIQCRSNTVGPSLKIKILLDAVRGSRGGTRTSRTMLLPLLKENPSCQVALFHSPKLRGILRAILPMRYNELMGLQHIKLYIIDDNVIMSGANLSHDYFTNRQDRYIHVKNCRQLANFYDGLINILCDMSLQLSESNLTTFPRRGYHPFEGSSHAYISELQRRIESFYESHVNQSQNIETSDTWIFSTIEVPFCDIHKDSEITTKLIEYIPEHSEVYLATGYFNLTEQLIRTILDSKSDVNLLMAHPTANGFYQSAGPSQHIPGMYTAICREFYNLVEERGVRDRIKCFEYQRKGWTFHAKGIWITLPEEKLPVLTVVGSSNFGVRSVSRDLESQIVIVTKNSTLKQQFHREQRRLFENGHLVDKNVFDDAERKIPVWINYFLWMLKSFL